MASGNAPNEQGCRGSRAPDLNLTCIHYLSARPVMTAPHVTAINCYYSTFFVWKGHNSLEIHKCDWAYTLFGTASWFGFWHSFLTLRTCSGLPYFLNILEYSWTCDQAFPLWKGKTTRSPNTSYSYLRITRPSSEYITLSHLFWSDSGGLFFCM